MSARLRDRVVYQSLRFVLGAGGRVPLDVARPCGRLLTRAALRVMPRERARMRFNIQTAFPELDRAQQDRLMRGCAGHLGTMLAEVAWLWHAEPIAVESLVEVEGFEHLLDALAGSRGVILATGHLGNWELLNARLAVEGIPITLAVRELDNDRVNDIVTTLRGRFGSEIIMRGVSAGRQLVRALVAGRGVGLLIDQDIPSIPGVFVPFFGRPAWTPSGAAMLALRVGCPIMPGFIHRRPDGSHKIKIEAPLPVPTEGSLHERVRELTTAATAAVEWQVRAWPEQWVWMHRRWRTRPEPGDRV